MELWRRHGDGRDNVCRLANEGRMRMLAGEWGWGLTMRKLRRGEAASLFDFWHVADTEANRAAVITARVKRLAAQQPWLVDGTVDMPSHELDVMSVNVAFANCMNELANGLDGTVSFTDRSGRPQVSWDARLRRRQSLIRHLLRSAAQVSVMVELTEADGLAAQGLSKNDLRWCVPAAWLHDIGRLITHGSEHEVWGERLLDRIGVRTEIRQAIHRPVPATGSVEDFRPEEYDSIPQSITRLADVMGKVDLRSGRLRGRIAELRAFSEAVQMDYWRRGGGQWSSGRKEAEEEITGYVAKEALAWQRAVDWLASVGVDWEQVVEQVNSDWRATGSYMAQVMK